MNDFEQEHLKMVYAFLTDELSRLDRLVDKTTQEASETKKNLAQDTRLNFDSLADNIDTFANIESGSRQIDALNSKVDYARKQQKLAKLLLPEAYFARIDLDFGDDDVEPFYIGKVGYAKQDSENLIYDWRTPVADVYYSSKLGPTSYQANGRKIVVDLKLRRQFQIKDEELLSVIDTKSAINDPVLLEILAAPHADYLKDITTTIQAEQNAVIRNTSADVLIVDGVAGSGKTSVLLQRIAYLRYVHRQTWQPDAFLLFTPSAVFAQYIKDVLPALGEQNPSALTFDQYLEKLSRYFGTPVSETDLDSDQHLRQIEIKLNEPAPKKLATLIPGLAKTDPADNLLDRLQLVWRRLVATDQVPDDLNEWLDWQKIFAALELPTPTNLQILYFIIHFTQFTQDHVKALFVDEAQDYTEDQVLLMMAIFRQSHITLVGDHNQSLDAHSFDYQSLPAQFETQKCIVTSISLMTSYRSTGAITQFFGQFNQNGNDSLIKPVQPTGETPTVIEKISTKDLITLIENQRKELVGNYAIIVSDNDEAQRIFDQLHDQIDHTMAVITTRDHLKPNAEIQILPLAVAKGLEFDQVLVLNFQDSYFSDPDFGDHRKYVATSRATKQLTVIDEVISSN